jgi:hypothetical protein
MAVRAAVAADEQMRRVILRRIAVVSFAHA